MESFEKKRVSAEERRAKSNAKIKEMGMACFEELPMREDSSQVKLKDLDSICKRAIACLLSTQLACDIVEGNDYEESRKMFLGLMDEYGVEEYLLSKEQRLFSGDYSKQEVIDVVWTYEAYWSLVWALGLIDDIEVPDSVCDCMTAIKLVGDCQNYEEFRSKVKLRDIEEVLDMLDLHYRYHWACVEKRINPETVIGLLNPEVVIERRRGLEWLISEEKDWYDISLDT